MPNLVNIIFRQRNHSAIWSKVRIFKRFSDCGCVQIPNTTKIMITGGKDGSIYHSSTEIFDTSTRTISYGPSMNSQRAYHGLGILTILNEDRVVAIGGYTGSQNLDTVEAYNQYTNTWGYLSIQLLSPKRAFGSLTIKEGDI